LIDHGHEFAFGQVFLDELLQKNAGLKVRCGTARLRVETTDSVLTSGAAPGDVLDIPINHFEGNYTCSPETLAELRDEDRIVVRYVDNPNGSVDDIDRTDERDVLISRRGDIVGYYVASAGAVIALIITMLEYDYFWIANTLYLSFVVAGLVAGIVKLRAYRRGF
jgi:hypothetical protein